MITDIIYDFVLSVDGLGQVGKCEDVKLPKVAVKTADFDAGGTLSTHVVQMGGIEKLEAEFTLHSQSAEVLEQMDILPGREVPLTLRAAMVDGDGTKKPLVAKLRGKFLELETDTIKPHDKVPLKCKFVADYYKLEIDSEEIYEIDIVNYLFTVRGTDQLAVTRSHLGI